MSRSALGAIRHGSRGERTRRETLTVAPQAGPYPSHLVDPGRAKAPQQPPSGTLACRKPEANAHFP